MSHHADPTFEAVAAKEAADQRELRRSESAAELDRVWRGSDEYRKQRRRKIVAALRKSQRK